LAIGSDKNAGKKGNQCRRRAMIELRELQKKKGWDEKEGVKNALLSEN